MSLLFAVILCGCQRPLNRQAAGDEPTFEGAQPPLVHKEELYKYLKATSVLRRLNVKDVVVLKGAVDYVIIGDKDSGKQVGEIYYTIQSGWYLKRPNEVMEHKDEKGWLIWEQ